MKSDTGIVYEPWIEQFDERQQGLIRSCRQYTIDGAPGLPGHQLMLIVARLAVFLDELNAAIPAKADEEKS